MSWIISHAISAVKSETPHTEGVVRMTHVAEMSMAIWQTTST